MFSIEAVQSQLKEASSSALQSACLHGTIADDGSPGIAHLAYHSNFPRVLLMVSRDLGRREVHYLSPLEFEKEVPSSKASITLLSVRQNFSSSPLPQNNYRV